MKKLIHKFLVYLTYVLAVFILLADISVFISPAEVWPAAFFGLAFPYLMILNFVFFVYWIITRKKVFMISLIALLLSINNVSHTFQPPKSNREQISSQGIDSADKSMKILTYNVQIFNLFGNSLFGDQQQKIFDFIFKVDPDIICFQEFYVNELKNFSIYRVNGLLKQYEHRHIVWIQKGEYSRYGIAIYSKFPLINKEELSFQNSSNISIYSDVAMGYDTVRIFNNHLQSINFDNKSYEFITNQKTYSQSEKIRELQNISVRLKDAFIKRGQQANFLAKKIDESSYPVVVCGDFNDTPVSYTYRTIREDMKDAFIEAGSGFGSTYGGRFPSYRIDYILHSSSLKTQSFNTERIKHSDHYPVMARIFWSTE